MNHYPDGHNIGPGYAYDTPEEKHIAELEARVKKLYDESNFHMNKWQKDRVELMQRVPGYAYMNRVDDPEYEKAKAALFSTLARAEVVAPKHIWDDAARYRWRRESSLGQYEHPICVSQNRVERGMQYVGPLCGDALDKAVDAAMSAGSPMNEDRK